MTPDRTGTRLRNEHGGEGTQARAEFFGLEDEDKNALRVYLISMRRAPRVMVP